MKAFLPSSSALLAVEAGAFLDGETERAGDALFADILFNYCLKLGRVRD